ncbi:hypothetical protein Dd1591_3418 [Dickeya chrysanthemi Ech1591]|uniref:Integrase catalytic domain-containing protein n=1 Tax=Dickeya chrysanthemi (strain Ech1591) TaxID=561229 RepID=C6CJJ7_DICC1|nr:hypothetical protein Dd1591_3418 [Dickeya chrysanthemi Ech1591]
MALYAVEHREISIRLACQVFVISECCYRYRRLLSQENQIIADWLVRITDSQRNWGVRSVLPVSVQRERLCLEPQKNLPDLLRTVAEYAGNTLIIWAERQNIILNFIQPGKPQQNAYIERYNRTVRYDWLGHYLFYSLSELQEYATQWQWWVGSWFYTQ